MSLTAREKRVGRSLNNFILQVLLGFALLLVIGNLVINRAEHELKAGLKDELQLSLRSSVKILELWADEQKKFARYIQSDPEVYKNLINLIKKAGKTNGSREQLIKIPELAQLRRNLKPVLSDNNILGFVVFNQEGLQVGALLDEALGRDDLQRLSDFFQRSIKGEFVISIPFKGEVPLLGKDGIKRPDQPTMFISLPIKDKHGEILGVFALRQNPAINFSRVLQINRSKKTGETYTFSKDGAMLSASRFDHHLRPIGLIEDNDWSTSILKVQIRDPGVNMVEGIHSPTKPDLWPLTLMASQAVQGKDGVNVEGYNDYRGVPVIGAWAWLPKFGMGITSEIDVEEAYQPIKTLTFWFWALFSVSLFIFLGLVILFWRKKDADEKVRNAQQRFKVIVDKAFGGIITINQECLIQTYNTAAEKIFGFKEKEVIGKNINILMPEPYHTEHDQYVRNYLKTGNSSIIGNRREVTAIRKNGSTFPLELDVSEIFMDDHLFFIGQCYDITERKKIETVEKEEAAYLRLNQAITFIASESMSLMESIKLTLESVCKSTGWPVGHAYLPSAKNRNLLLPSKQWFLENPDSFQSFVKITEQTQFESGKGLPGRVLETKQPHWIANVHEDKNFPRAQQAREIEVKGAFAFPILVGNEVAAVIEFFSSEIAQPNKKLLTVMAQVGERLGRVVERVQASKKLIKAKEVAEQANAAKSEFLSRMSHELRTPMTAILGFAQLTMNNTVEVLSENQKDNLGEIEKAGNHLLELINEVLDLSKIESGEMSVALESLEIASVLEEVIPLVTPLADQNNVQLINEVKPETGLCVIADRLRLKQALMNLISNAIKYNKPEGTVHIYCESERQDTIQIHVRDTGPGISKENITKLFEPFERLGAEFSEVSGTGIGLTITQKMVGLMNGKLKVSSELGLGSIFTVKLPASANRLQRIDSTADSESASKFIILYVEDNPTNLRLMKKVFSLEEDIELLTAPDAELGFELAKRNSPDLVLLDINLPGESGISLLKSLKKDERTKDISAIAISSNSLPEEIEKGLEEGFKYYFTKPLDVDKLMETIWQELLSKSPSI